MAAELAHQRQARDALWEHDLFLISLDLWGIPIRFKRRRKIDRK